MAEHGYPDWQPPGVVVAAGGESPLVISQPAVARKATYVSPIIESKLYQSLGGTFIPDSKGHYLKLTLKWFYDAAATIPSAVRAMVVAPAGAGPAGNLNLHVKNLGSYLRVEYGILGGGAEEWEAEWHMALDNRGGVLESAITSPILIAEQFHTVVQAKSLVVLPAYYYAGPALFGGWINQVVQFSAVVIETVDPATGEWEPFVTRELVHPNTWEVLPLQTPLGAWRSSLANSTTMTTDMAIFCAPATTGGS